MKYARDSVEAALLDGEPEAIGTVSRWISTVLADVRFWGLRAEWGDLHQEAMSGVLASLRRGRFEPGRDFRAYVQAVARYTIRYAVRQRRRRAEEGSVAEPASTNAAAAEVSILRSLTVRKVLERLPEECRGLVVAYYFEQRGYEEIASSLGVPVGTVKSRLFRCLDTARQALEQVPPGRAGTQEAGPSRRSGRRREFGKEPAR